MSDEPLPPLGDLELAVLEHLWSSDESDVTTAHAAVGRSRGITANTVGSALERLFRKDLVTRHKVSHRYRYRAALDRETFSSRRLLDAVGGADGLRDAGVLAAFVDAVGEVDEATLDRLSALIEARRGRE